MKKKATKSTKGRSVKGRVTRTDKDNLSGAVSRDEYRDMPIDDAWFADGKPAANVGFSMGHTINKGDYESVRIECSLHVPCLSGEIAAVQPKVRSTVEDWLGEAVVNAKRELGLLGDFPEAGATSGADKPVSTPDGGSTPKSSDTAPEAQETGNSDGSPPWETEFTEEPSESSAEAPKGGDEDFDLMQELGIV